MKNMKNIKKMIVVLLIICVLIIIAVLSISIMTLKKDNDKIETEAKEQQDLQKMVADNESNIIKKIETEAEFFNVSKCIDNYKTCSNYLYYADLYGEVPENEKNNLELKKKQLLNIMPEFVIQKLDLNANNIYKKIGLPDKIIRIDSVYVSTQKVKSDDDIDNINVKAYIANGVFIDRESYQKEQFSIVVLMDTKNDTFLIVPQKYIEQENIDLNEGKNLDLYEKGSIENKEYNTYKETMETEEDMSKEYVNRFRENLTNDPSYVYNSLDEEYRNKRFGTYQDFINYINSNQKELNKIKLKSYIVNHNDNNTEYICKDQYENLYIFEQTSPLDFSLKLDTYTIATEKFKETYNSSKDSYKCQMNIDKFFQMINRQDYKTSYECLAQSYKNNYFKTEESFENYVKNNFFTYNKVSYEDVEQKGDKLYVFTIKLTDLTGENKETKEVTIVMQLNEDLNFEMSFSM